MQKYIFHLSGESLSLATEEVKALFETYDLKYKILKQKNGLLLIESSASEKQVLKLSERSAMIKSSGILISTLKNLLLSEIGKINWNFVKMPYCVRVEDLTGDAPPGIETKLASPIWWFFEKKSKDVSVNLTNPKTTVYFILDKNIIYLQKLIWKAEKGRFIGREPMKKPAFHPTALKPKLARLLVNLSRAQEKELFLDCFCGTGSILIEAAIIGCKVFGVDIDKKMINASKTNLNFYKIKKYKLINGNATQLENCFKSNSVEAIATDPPYGRSSRIGAKNIHELYKNFLKSAYKVLKRGDYLALMYPHYEKLVIKKFKIVTREKIYVHSSLTRNIIVLKK